MKSMTGFGRAQGNVSRDGADVDITVEIRTVNSRYLDFKAHLPRDLLFMELDLKQIVQEKVHRGRVDLFLDVQQKVGEELMLNRSLVDRLISLSEELKQAGVHGDLLVSDLIRFPGVMSGATVDWGSEPVGEMIREVTQEALGRLLDMRDVEGAALQEEIKGRISTLEALHQQLVALSGTVREHYRTKLMERLREISTAALDENRTTQEIIFLSEKADISEELARFQSHLSVLSQTLESANGEESIGKRLDFLCQELNREVTTIISKSVLVEGSNLALEAKVEIEKIREQVQNVE